MYIYILNNNSSNNSNYKVITTTLILPPGLRALALPARTAVDHPR